MCGNPYGRQYRELIARVAAGDHRRPAVEIQRISQVQPELLLSRPKRQVEIALPVLSVRRVLAVWNSCRSGEVCQAVEVVDPTVVRIELVEIGPDRIHP